MDNQIIQDNQHFHKIAVDKEYSKLNGDFDKYEVYFSEEDYLEWIKKNTDLLKDIPKRFDKEWRSGLSIITYNPRLVPWLLKNGKLYPHSYSDGFKIETNATPFVGLISLKSHMEDSSQSEELLNNFHNTVMKKYPEYFI